MSLPSQDFLRLIPARMELGYPALSTLRMDFAVASKWHRDTYLRSQLQDDCALAVLTRVCINGYPCVYLPVLAQE